MKFLMSLVPVAALVLLPLLAHADETPEKQLEFVRKLRAKGYTDLAVQYLDILKKNPPPGFAQLLQLELARTNVSLARDKEPAQRLVLLAAARQDLEKLVKANPNSPQSAQVRLEIARIASLQGYALLMQGFRQDDDSKAEEFARKAEQQYIQAGTELETAVKSLEAALKDQKAATAQEKLVQHQLTQDLMQARFERGKNYLDQAKTYLNTSKPEVNLKRAEVVDKGKETLEAVAREDLDKSPETSYLAVAWLIRVYQEAQDPTKATDYYRRVMTAKGKDLGLAQRWAVYFYMQGIPTDKKITLSGAERLKLVKSMGEEWLNRFGAYKNTPEGQAVRFELAGTLFKMAQNTSAKEQKAGLQTTYYQQARKLLKSLEEGDSDYSRRAAQLNDQISMQLMGTDTPLEKLKDFDECFLRARYEMSKMQDVAAQLRAKPGDEKLEKQRQKHLHNTVGAFQRGLRLAGAKTPLSKLDEARFYLTIAYMMSGDPYRTVVQGEALARQQPSGNRSAAAAGYALQAYASILSRADENVESNRQRLRDLAHYILETKAKDWATESVVPIARYQLAMAYLRDKEHMLAVANLEQIPKEFSAYIFSQCQLAFAALLARDEGKLTEKQFIGWVPDARQREHLLRRLGYLEEGKVSAPALAKATQDFLQLSFQAMADKLGTVPVGEKDAAAINLVRTQVAGQRAIYEQKALDALKRVGTLPKDADPATAQMFFAAQLEQGKFLYRAASIDLKKNNAAAAVEKYKEMYTFCDGLLKQLHNFKASLDPEPKANLEHAITALGKYAKFGKADAEYRMGNFELVLKDTADVVQLVEAKGKAAGTGLIQMRDYQLTGDILGLALRATVQTGDVKKAEDYLRLLQRLSGEEGKGVVSDPTAVLRSLLGELQGQLKELRAKGDQEKLKKTVGTFSKFIDVLANQSKGKGLNRNDVLFMATCYTSLDQHDKAAGLYAMYPEAKFDPSKSENKEYIEEFKKDTQLYWLVQVFQAQELRKAKKLKEAKLLLERVLTPEREEIKVAVKAKAIPEKEAAGLSSAGRLPATKEEIHLLEDQQLYGTAITKWGAFLQRSEVKRQDNKMKEMYFQSYYHYAYCWYKYSQSPKIKGTPKEAGFVKKAADYIVGLEFTSSPEGWGFAGPLFRELLRDEPTLNAVYMPLRQEAEKKRQGTK